MEEVKPRIRFVKIGEFTGTKADGTACHISVNGDRVFEIATLAIVGQDGYVDVTFLDGSIFRLHSTEVELTTPQPYRPVPTNCCQK